MKQQGLLPDVNLLDAFLEHPMFDEDGQVPIPFSTIYDYQQSLDFQSRNRKGTNTKH